MLQKKDCPKATNLTRPSKEGLPLIIPATQCTVDRYPNVLLSMRRHATERASNNHKINHNNMLQVMEGVGPVHWGEMDSSPWNRPADRDS